MNKYERSPDGGWIYREYDWNERFKSNKREEVRKELAEEISECGSVIELGCGMKHLEKYLDCKSYTGFDYTEEFEPDIQGDLTKVTEEEIPSKSYDVAVIKNVLQHIVHWKSALSNAFRIPKKELYIVERLVDGQTHVYESRPIMRRRFNSQDISKAIDKYTDREYFLELKSIECDNRLGMFIIKFEE